MWIRKQYSELDNARQADKELRFVIPLSEFATSLHFCLAFALSVASLSLGGLPTLCNLREATYDFTKSLRDDPDHFAAFDKALGYIKDGTPIRKTNRAGYGMKGTRLVEKIGSHQVEFRLK